MRVRIMLEGICPIMYPAVRTEMAELKSLPTSPRSSSKVLRRACLYRQDISITVSPDDERGRINTHAMLLRSR